MRGRKIRKEIFIIISTIALSTMFISCFFYPIPPFENPNDPFSDTILIINGVFFGTNININTENAEVYITEGWLFILDQNGVGLMFRSTAGIESGQLYQVELTSMGLSFFSEELVPPINGVNDYFLLGTLEVYSLNDTRFSASFLFQDVGYYLEGEFNIKF